MKKQRHTARRIFDRLVEEKGFEGGESTIRRAVHEIRGKMPRAFVPLQFDPADAIQVDWGEATVYLNGEKTVNIALDEQIKLLSKQLKIPTFAGYHNIQNHADPNSTFGELLLELMRTENKRSAPADLLFYQSL